jgi:hypothetical protein
MSGFHNGTGSRGTPVVRYSEHFTGSEVTMTLPDKSPRLIQHVVDSGPMHGQQMGMDLGNRMIK